MKTANRPSPAGIGHDQPAHVLCTGISHQSHAPLQAAFRHGRFMERPVARKCPEGIRHRGRYSSPLVVDDQCTRIGGTWADIPDAGAGCLIAELMYRYYLYTQDIEFLRSTAWPFMIGIMRVCEVMLEKNDGIYRMPFGISPAFRGTADSRVRGESRIPACRHQLFG